MADTCRSCHAEIEFARTVNGRRIPINPDGDLAAGNIVFDADGIAHVVPAGEGTHTSHFATCSDPARFRRKTKR